MMLPGAARITDLFSGPFFHYSRNPVTVSQNRSGHWYIGKTARKPAFCNNQRRAFGRDRIMRHEAGRENRHAKAGAEIRFLPRKRERVAHTGHSRALPQ